MTILLSLAHDGRPMPGTLLSVDDTDSPDGMCTTYLATLLIREMDDLDLIGPPRLVRLNPNIPWKTRGNAAVCLSFGHGQGVPRVCGSVMGLPVQCFPRGIPTAPSALLERAAAVIERNAQFDCDKTNPGAVASLRRPAKALYWQAVRRVVERREVERALGACGAEWRGWKNGRGIIGAASSMSWVPHDRTWEVIVYRRPERIGTPREIDPESVVFMDKSTRLTFNNYDYENHHIAIAPRSPCPVLFGIRGDDRDELLVAKGMIESEPPESWLLFMTNQGTDDHIVPRTVSGAAPRESVRLRVRVASRAQDMPGGHVILRAVDANGIDLAFYEPSRSFRKVARALVPGDDILVYGTVRDTPRSLNVEKLRVVKLGNDRRKVGNPVCPACGKSMGSLGSAQGYRCKRCGAKASAAEATYIEVPRAIGVGWYEPPVAARRHLHKPLRRMPTSDFNKL
jgi:tRNA(Ile2)-agmatinylcytidine synthase